MRNTREVVSSDAVTTVRKSGETASSSTPLVCPYFTAWHVDARVSQRRTAPSTEVL